MNTNSIDDVNDTDGTGGTANVGVMDGAERREMVWVNYDPLLCYGYVSVGTSGFVPAVVAVHADFGNAVVNTILGVRHGHSSARASASVNRTSAST